MFDCKDAMICTTAVKRRLGTVSGVVAYPTQLMSDHFIRQSGDHMAVGEACMVGCELAQ